MICNPCRTAGDASANVDHLLLVMDYGLIFETIRDLHGKCKNGSWCDCQHMISLVPEEPVKIEVTKIAAVWPMSTIELEDAGPIAKIAQEYLETKINLRRDYLSEQTQRIINTLTRGTGS